MVDLAVIPHEQTHLVVCGTALRKPLVTIQAYLQSLAWQVKPQGVQFFYLFIDDGLDAATRVVVDQFVAEHGGQVIPSGQAGAPDFSDTGQTHNWTDTAMARVGRCKDYILDLARKNRAEACWFVDADLIMDPMTFTSLWSVPEQIVCGTYWTVWVKTQPEGQPVHAGPQVWQGHPYNLNGNGMEEWELRRKLIDRQLVHVYGQGACTLIRQEALRKGVSFAPMPGNTGAGLMQGEDRHFCLRAESLHIKMVADGWPDIFHIYHRPEDEQRIPEMVQRLSRVAAGDPHSDLGVIVKLGDLISLDLKALEPVPTHQGSMYPPPQLVRGRLGKLALQPELEQAILEMARGETRVVPVHFPLSYPFPPYRGKRKLIRTTLIDHKPMGFQPVIESEIIKNDIGGWTDTITLSPELLEEMREVHAA